MLEYVFNEINSTKKDKGGQQNEKSDEIETSDFLKSHTAYEMKAMEYAKLQQAGVADSVLNFMQKTHLDLIRQDQQMQDSYYWYPGYGGYGYGWPGYGFGWPYGYWGWNMRPSMIFRGGGGYYHGGGVHRGGVHRGGQIRR